MKCTDQNNKQNTKTRFNTIKYMNGNLLHYRYFPFLHSQPEHPFQELESPCCSYPGPRHKHFACSKPLYNHPINWHKSSSVHSHLAEADISYFISGKDEEKFTLFTILHILSGLWRGQHGCISSRPTARSTFGSFCIWPGLHSILCLTTLSWTKNSARSKYEPVGEMLSNSCDISAV